MSSFALAPSEQLVSGRNSRSARRRSSLRPAWLQLRLPQNPSNGHETAMVDPSKKSAGTTRSSEKERERK